MPASSVLKSLGSIGLQAVMWLPNLVLHRDAATSAASVGGDPKQAPMGDAKAGLHAPAGSSCAKFAQPLAATDPTRKTAKGFVHEACPS